MLFRIRASQSTDRPGQVPGQVRIAKGSVEIRQPIQSLHRLRIRRVQTGFHHGVEGQGIVSEFSTVPVIRTARTIHIPFFHPFNVALLIPDQPFDRPGANLFSPYPDFHLHLFPYGNGFRSPFLHHLVHFLFHILVLVDRLLNRHPTVLDRDLLLPDHLPASVRWKGPELLILLSHFLKILLGTLQRDGDFRLIRRSRLIGSFDLCLNRLLLRRLLFGQQPGQLLRIRRKTGQRKIKHLPLHINGQHLITQPHKQRFN